MGKKWNVKAEFNPAEELTDLKFIFDTNVKKGRKK